jgi:hypothetical protein
MYKKGESEFFSSFLCLLLLILLRSSQVHSVLLSAVSSGLLDRAGRILLMKTCLDCHESKDLTDFPIAAKRSDGRGSYCKACMLERSKVSYRKRALAKGKSVRPVKVMIAGYKTCPDCNEHKPVEDFPKNKGTADGRHTYCKPCHNARGRETADRLYGGTSFYHRKYRYGLEAGEWDEMMLDQGDVCGVCGERPAVHLDHDHVTGKIRGILCFNCNGGLGQFGDRVDIMMRAIDYLERTSESQWQRTLASTAGYPPITRPRAAAASTTSSERLRRICFPPV